MQHWRVIVIDLAIIPTYQPSIVWDSSGPFAASCGGSCVASSLGILSPASYGNSFTAIITASTESGQVCEGVRCITKFNLNVSVILFPIFLQYSVTSGVGSPSSTLIVTSQPDSSSTLTCALTVVAVGSTTLCTLHPRNSGRRIFVLASAYGSATVTTSADGGTGGMAVATGVSSEFTLLYTATQSGVVSVSDGVAGTTPFVIINTGTYAPIKLKGNPVYQDFLIYVI